MTTKNSDSTEALNYGRARLYLGISAVGTLVMLSSLVLAWALVSEYESATETGLIAEFATLFLFITLYALVQMPFDFLGGYWLPKQFGRTHPTLGKFLRGLFRGVVAQGTILLFSAVLITAAGRYGGIVGIVAVSVVISLFLLQFRFWMASTIAPIIPVNVSMEKVLQTEKPNVIIVESSDEGFTGGIMGVLRPRSQLLPLKWQHVLGVEGFKLAASRRTVAINIGSWWRGRVVALAFTTLGVLLSALLVDHNDLGTAWGTIQLSLWFSLWSFLGLLTLPTLSRRGVLEIDEALQATGDHNLQVRINTERLDRLQDNEPSRTSLIEAIFHPVPCVKNRIHGAKSKSKAGFWDVARTSIYLSIAGIGLLGRAVHCNCGRPALWVFLPTD